MERSQNTKYTNTQMRIHKFKFMYLCSSCVPKHLIIKCVFPPTPVIFIIQIHKTIISIIFRTFRIFCNNNNQALATAAEINAEEEDDAEEV